MAIFVMLVKFKINLFVFFIYLYLYNFFFFFDSSKWLYPVSMTAFDLADSANLSWNSVMKNLHTAR